MTLEIDFTYTPTLVHPTTILLKLWFLNTFKYIQVSAPKLLFNHISPNIIFSH